MAYDPQKLKQTLEAITKQEPVIEEKVKEVLSDLTLDTLPDYSLIDLTNQLTECHPYMKLLHMSILTKQGVLGKHYLLISNEAVSISLYKSGRTVIRVYAATALKEKARVKYQ